MDELDKEILMQLKEDSRRSVTEISKAIGRSHSATRVRLANLIESEVISRFTIELANYKEEMMPKGFVDVVLPNGAKADRIASALADVEEVTDISLVTGKYNCQLLIQCEAVGRIQLIAEMIQERLGSKESRVRIITGSIPGYPKTKTPIFFSHLTEVDSQDEESELTAEVPFDESRISSEENVSSDSPSDNEDTEILEKVDSENATDSDFLVWTFQSHEEKIVKEVRPVIGA
ncbi:MAG: Lrp/AsnC family transcriptional regulator [Acidimicrobiales bacterium]|nr:Lrp/AsnC family transcriptional regulator [Acidimicrobiales bacterium]HJM29083.1 Lrp/AsnC family transcriptional regulator [Acidimicrobiales bacterium]